MDRDLLFLACRHHIYELLLRNVYEKCLKITTSGPDVALFKRFSNNWKFFVENKQLSEFMPGILDAKVAEVFISDKQEIIEFVTDQLKVNFFIRK